MFALPKLRDESLNGELKKLLLRGVLAAPLHIACFAGCLAAFDVLQNFVVYQYCLYLLIGSLIARSLVWFFGEPLLRTHKGRTLYRLGFAIPTTFLGLSWGITAATLGGQFGFAPVTTVFVTIMMGISASSVPAYCFEPVVNFMFQLGIALPFTFVMVRQQNEGSVIMGYAFPAFPIFMVLVTKTLSKSLIGLLRNKEIIEEQSASIEKAHLELKGAHDTVHGMLASINEAFMIFDLNGTCFNNPSLKAGELLGFDPTGKPLWEILTEEETNRPNLQTWFSLLTSERLPFADVVAMGPKTIQKEKQGMTLSLNFSPMRDESGTLVSVIMTANDVTREMRAKRLADEARERAELILRINENKAGFRSFLEDFERVIDRLLHWDGRDLVAVRRDLHTLKGCAALFSVTILSQSVQEFEIKIKKLQDEGGTSSEILIDIVKREATKLSNSYGGWKVREGGLLNQLGVFDEESIQVPKKRLAKIESALASLPAVNSAFQGLVRQLTTCEFGELLEGFEYQIKKASAKLGKQATVKVELDGEPFVVSPAAYRDVIRSLVHVINNSVDHGIETPEERLAKGKPAMGTLTMRYGRAQKDGRNWLKLTITDDGRGVDTVRLREKLKAAGNVRAEALSETELLQHIFDDGLTTRAEVTEFSGHGIGMGAVRAAVLKSRGKIRIVSSSPAGTEFEILLPDQSLIVKAAEPLGRNVA